MPLSTVNRPSLMMRLMLNVIVIGLGPIGISAARAVAEDRKMKLAGLVDLDPAKLGKSLNQLSGNGSCSRSGPKVVGSIGTVKTSKPAVAIVTTASHFDRVAP